MKDDIKLEKDVPIPKQYRKPAARKYPFHTMEVGESFAVPKSKDKSVRSAASWEQQNSPEGKQFTCRAMDDNTTRVWRTK